MPKPSADLAAIVQKRFKVTPDQAQELIHDMVSEHYTSLLAWEKESGSQCLFDRFDLDDLAKRVSAGEKYLEIKIDGLKYGWVGKSHDDAEVLERSLINLELWLFDRRLRGRW